MNAADRDRLARIERMSDVLGLPPVRCARMLDSEAAEAAAEDRRREARRQAAIEQHEAAAWAHQHANMELGLPADCSMAERLAALNPMTDEPTRDHSAPYGSASNPAFFASTPGGGLVDLGYQRQQAAGQAQRSWTQAHDDALIARAKEQSRDSFMVIQCQRFHQRQRAREAQRATAAAGPPAQRYEASGLGWPQGEIAR